jgi:hypothetical protein
MPSEPDKLQILAKAMHSSTDDLVAQVHEAKSRVRAIYRSGVSQLEKSWS